MQTTTTVLETSAHLSSWATLFQKSITPFPNTQLPILSGAIPSGLKGRLYRVGPARFERGGERISHWFDGDGAVLGIHFQEGTVTAAYQFVETAGYVAEEKAGKFLLGGYGRRSSWRHPGTKNAANTSMLALEDQLWALWEGGHPYRLDPDTLQTIGEAALTGIAPQHTFSAHPKRDPKTGDVYNFGLSFGRKPKLHLYRCDRRGTVQQQSELALDATPMIHDFAMVGSYLIFCVSPVTLSVLPLLLRQQSYSDALRWQPQRGTQLLFFDRDTLELVSRGEADPWFQWHFGNGYQVSDDEVVLDILRYPDFQSNTFLKEVPSGAPKSAIAGNLWRYRFNPKQAKVIHAEPLSDRAAEFPTVHPMVVGQQHPYTYMVAQSDQAKANDLFDAIAYCNHRTETFQWIDLGGNRFPSELIVAPNPETPEKNWVLSVVYDGKTQASEVWIWDGQHLEDGPVCRLELPSPIAFGFHGTWKAA
jgi:all-trans-8'-apo-beta-carotenal 15,15'-oxygenase